MKLAIYGAGKFGQFIYSQISSCDNIGFKFFIDNNKKRDYSGAYIISGKLFKEKYYKEVDTVLVAIADWTIVQKIVLELLPWFEGEICIPNPNVLSGKLTILDENGNFTGTIKRYRDVKPVLS